MEPEELVRRHPRVFHVAPALAWPSIERHGLLPAADLVALHGVTGARRRDLLESPRRSPALLEAPGEPPALLRDQRPMKYLAERIAPHSSVAQFLAAVNGRVFCWATPARLARLRGARAYRDLPQLVLHLDTARLLERHGDRVGLCRLNSGAIMYPTHPVRGHDVWQPVADYPYDELRRRHGAAGALAEVTVLGPVADALDLVVEVEDVG
ncbi:DUF7002 family protein [Nocardioides litoris]|uniref:DUF7002 family protein n=1 Tax=Nocardioides litoris TaxID=1926648 RepID=UPI001120F3DA|nr:hypothetical protein [Nocardioides litoris]